MGFLLDDNGNFVGLAGRVGCAFLMTMGFIVGAYAVEGELDLKTKKQPLWEIAIGGGAMRIPDYRGAEDARGYVFPFIYPVYRGNFLRVDNEGVRGLLYKSRRVELDFSVDGAIPVNSDDIDVREGMPDLDPILQFGPSLRFGLWGNPQKSRSLVLNLPVRGAFAIDSGVDQIGYTFSPHITFHQGFDLIDRNWTLGLSAGLEFGSDEFHDYFYSVDDAFVTPTRPAFDADGGYGGTRFIVTMRGRTRKTWISLFARYDRVDYAIFNDSPLVVKDGGLTAGFIVTWFIAQSKKFVEITELRKR